VTPARREKVVTAAAQNHVAIEINNRYKLPSASFIKLAKEVGCKFTFGTNNTGAGDLGRCEYALQMVEECKLTGADFFVPLAVGSTKAVDRKGDILRGVEAMRDLRFGGFFWWWGSRPARRGWLWPNCRRRPLGREGTTVVRTDLEALYNQRLNRYTSAMRNGQPDRVPIRPLAAEITAKHAGFTCQEVTHDYRKAFEAVVRCCHDYEWDAVVPNMIYVWTGLTQAVGLRYYGVPGIDVGPQVGFQYREPGEDGAYMKREEYDDLIEDPRGSSMKPGCRGSPVK